VTDYQECEDYLNLGYLSIITIDLYVPSIFGWRWVPHLN